MAPVKYLISRARQVSGIDQMGDRERIVLAAGMLFVVCIMIFHFLVSPYFESRKQLLKSIDKKKRELVEMKLLRQEYEELRRQEGGIKTHLEKRQKNFTLFTFLDRQAAEASVKQKIKYMKPSTVAGDGDFSESLVEMKLQEVELEKLVRFLKGVESEANVVSVRRISIQTSPKVEGLLDVILQIVTFVEAG